MYAMVLAEPRTPLEWREVSLPDPGPGQVRVKVAACGVCRTDLHVVDGELTEPKLPIIPGHEIVGRVDALGAGVTSFRIGDRVGIPWLGYTCGHCSYCANGAENLCDRPVFTGYTRDGGFATHAVADASYAFDLDPESDPVSLAPLLCAGLIGWRSLKRAGDGKRIGISAAHLARSREEEGEKERIDQCALAGENAEVREGEAEEGAVKADHHQ